MPELFSRLRDAFRAAVASLGSAWYRVSLQTRRRVLLLCGTLVVFLVLRAYVR